MEKKLQKLYPTDYKLLIVQGLWQAHIFRKAIPVDSFYKRKQTFILLVITIEPFITIAQCKN